MCPALPKPSHGSWHRDDCNANSQVCRSVCLLRCDTVNGFKLEGPDRRECLATGQWSTPWSSYCKGMVFILHDRSTYMYALKATRLLFYAKDNGLKC